MRNFVLNCSAWSITVKNVMGFQLQNNLKIFGILTNKKKCLIVIYYDW